MHRTLRRSWWPVVDRRGFLGLLGRVVPAAAVMALVGKEALYTERTVSIPIAGHQYEGGDKADIVEFHAENTKPRFFDFPNTPLGMRPHVDT